jgi:hypothetical protein
MTGTRIHHHERPAGRIGLNPGRWDNTYQQVIYRTLQRPAVYHQLGLVVEDVRNCFGKVFAVLSAALAHDVEEKNAALGRIGPVIDRCAEKPGRIETRFSLGIA